MYNKPVKQSILLFLTYTYYYLNINSLESKYIIQNVKTNVILINMWGV